MQAKDWRKLMQLPLLEQATEQPFLHIVKDGTPVTLSLTQLFDASTYTHLDAITYVSSPKLFCKVASGFQQVQLILGIDDNDILKGFQQSITAMFDLKSTMEFWASLSEDTRDRIKSDHIRLRYGKLGVVIHTKLYLLSNTETGKTRVILGSANFSERALHGEKQYEDIIVFDDNPLFGVYTKRFQNIYCNTLDCIPDRLKQPASKDIVWTGMASRELGDK